MEFVCHHLIMRITLLNRCMVFEGNTQRGEGALPYMGYMLEVNLFLCCGKRHAFEVGYQFSPVDVTYKCILGVILRQSTCLNCVR